MLERLAREPLIRRALDQLPIVGGIFYNGLMQSHPIGHLWPAGTWRPPQYRSFEVRPFTPLAKLVLENRKSAK